jgi:hypothetical protein
VLITDWQWTEREHGDGVWDKDLSSLCSGSNGETRRLRSADILHLFPSSSPTSHTINLYLWDLHILCVSPSGAGYARPIRKQQRFCAVIHLRVSAAGFLLETCKTCTSPVASNRSAKMRRRKSAIIRYKLGPVEEHGGRLAQSYVSFTLLSR